MKANSNLDDCKGGRLKAQNAAAELYQLAALLVGDEPQAAALVEAAVARTEVDPCAEAEASFQAAQAALVEAAVAYLGRADAGAFNPPAMGSVSGGCIEGDGASAGGLDFGPKVLREGLNKLSTAGRVVFVLRAVLGWDSGTSAALLERATSRGWAAGQVSEVYRQALCSVSTSLLHSATAVS